MFISSQKLNIWQFWQLSQKICQWCCKLLVNIKQHADKLIHAIATILQNPLYYSNRYHLAPPWGNPSRSETTTVPGRRVLARHGRQRIIRSTWTKSMQTWSPQLLPSCSNRRWTMMSLVVPSTTVYIARKHFYALSCIYPRGSQKQKKWQLESRNLMCMCFVYRRYFVDVKALKEHFKTKVHKKR